MPTIPDKSIDMILCDLPYGTTACKWDVIIPFEPLWKEYKRVIKDRGCIALFGSEPFSSYLRMSNIKNYKYDWIWDKKLSTGHLNAKIMPMKRHEIISIFNSNNYYPVMEKGTFRLKGNKGNAGDGSNCYGKSESYFEKNDDYYPTTIIQFHNANQTEKQHPTQKPVSLLEYLIKTYTLENETILDNCMGSGSTGVACINTNRNFIGIEKEENYFNIAQKRINEAIEQKQSELF
jgi:site-specific DNA-methyltransferase (adenine-specific)